MATAEQIKSLIRSYDINDSERFYTIALQVAAHEAMQGHSTLAHEIKELITKKRKFAKESLKVVTFNPDLNSLVNLEESTHAKSELIIDDIALERLNKVIKEYFQQNKLKKYGLSHRRKLLLTGPPGTGKTLTAKVLAHELHVPLYTIQADRLVTKFMGETSAKLRQIFDLMLNNHGVYLFDEFDAIGSERTLENDVGEMRRVLNSFLQFIEQDKSDSIIIAATNNPQLLDHALFRRFDDVLEYHLPKENERKSLIENVLGNFKSQKLSWDKVISLSDGLSHAEIVNACLDTIKDAILDDKQKVNSSGLSNNLILRHGKSLKTNK